MQTLTRRALGRAHVPQTKVFPPLAVNKTILKPRLALAWVFPDVKFRIEAQLAGSLGKATKFRSLSDIGESNPVQASGL